MKNCSKCGRQVFGNYISEVDGKFVYMCGICLGLPRVTDNPLEVRHEGDVIVNNEDE
jgi:hypothetical protein